MVVLISQRLIIEQIEQRETKQNWSTCSDGVRISRQVYRQRASKLRVYRELDKYSKYKTTHKNMIIPAKQAFYCYSNVYCIFRPTKLHDCIFIQFSSMINCINKVFSSTTKYACHIMQNAFLPKMIGVRGSDEIELCTSNRCGLARQRCIQAHLKTPSMANKCGNCSALHVVRHTYFNQLHQMYRICLHSRN